MQTALKNSGMTGADGPRKESHKQDHVKRDRIVGILVLLAIMALMALMIWLSTLGGGSSGSFDYWPVMP